jgi:3-oxoacid CoA-transferase A subunit
MAQMHVIMARVQSMNPFVEAHMNKVVLSLREAVADIPVGAVVLIGGFGGSGLPSHLVNALVEQGARDLTIVCNDPQEWLPFAHSRQMRKLISGFTNHPLRPEWTRLIDGLVKEGQLEVETVPHGVLEERIRAGGAGFAAFYSPIGIGTMVEGGKEKRLFEGREYLLEMALKADYALVKGWKADRWGNVVTRLAAGNRNITMAMGARITIAEVEEIVELGELDPNRVDIPGIFVNRVVQAPKVVRWFIKGEDPV